MNELSLTPITVSLSSALERLDRSPLTIIAGGTDFFPALGDRRPPKEILNVSAIRGLRAIDSTKSGWRIGAATTWADIAKAELPSMFDGLKICANQVGSVQIQNNATVAGNLCNASPAADGVPALLALNAQVELASIAGTRLLRLSEFILGPRSTARALNELLVAVHIPAINGEVNSQYYKHGARSYMVISIIMASAVLVLDENDKLRDVRVAVGACSAVAQRMSALETALIGQSIQTDILSLVSINFFSNLKPINDVRASSDYRLETVYQVVRRLLSASQHALLQRRKKQPPQGVPS